VDTSKNEITQSASVKSTLDEFVFINDYSGVQATHPEHSTEHGVKTSFAEAQQPATPPSQPTQPPTQPPTQNAQPTTQPTQTQSNRPEVNPSHAVDAAPLPSSTNTNSLPATVGATSTTYSSKPLQNQRSFDVREYLANVFRDTSISEKSPVSVLNGIDDSCVEVLEKHAGVTNLLMLASLKETNPKICAFLVESGIQPNLNELIEHARILLQHFNQSHTSSTNELNQSLLQSSSNVSENQQRNHVDKEQHPLSVLPGISEAKLDKYLQSNAFVFTVGQLASFVRDFPGIYAVMTETTPILDEYIQKAEEYLAQ